MTVPLTFVEMLKHLRLDGVFTQQEVAKKLGISGAYLCDLEQGRRKPSVNVINRICTYMGRGPKGRAEWHQAAARACGWEIDP